MKLKKNAKPSKLTKKKAGPANEMKYASGQVKKPTTKAYSK